MEPPKPSTTDPQADSSSLDSDDTPAAPPSGVIYPTETALADDESSTVTSAQADVTNSPPEAESLDLSQLETPTNLPTGSMIEETPVQPSPSVEAAPTMPAFMQPSQPPASTSSTTSTSTTINQTIPSSSSPGGSTAFQLPQQPQPPLTYSEPSGPQAPAAVVVHKSRKLPIIIAIVVALLLIGGGALAYVLTREKDAPTSSDTTSNSSEETPESNDNNQDSSAKTVAASSLSDFSEVCKGGGISNAADYTSNQSAVVVGFHNKPTTEDFWSSDLVGYGKSYYPDIDEYQKISAVACIQYIEGSAQAERDCNYKDSQDKPVTVKYNSTKYKLTFYEAKTGKEISTGPDIDGPASSCPSFITYDPDTKIAYASPDREALEAAFDAFVK